MVGGIEKIAHESGFIEEEVSGKSGVIVPFIEDPVKNPQVNTVGEAITPSKETSTISTTGESITPSKETSTVLTVYDTSVS